MKNIARAAGVLLPLYSLPGYGGIGTMGKEAFRFVDFLATADQSYWQMLPIGQTSFGDSPYQSPSSFAGNPYFIDLEALYSEGLLNAEDLAQARAATTGFVDYAALYRTRPAVLKKAFARFKETAALERFKAEQCEWLADYALFAALKDENPAAVWSQRDEKIACRDPKTIAELTEKYRHEIDCHAFVQYTFFKQWDALKQYANARGIKIIGDIPIYVSYDGADVWANPGLFELDDKLTPVRVAGCPPDEYAIDGQKWGNPLYKWDVHKNTGYAWWIKRLAHNFKMFDMLRIDHFRGFESYFAIPASAPTAADGVWEKGPAESFIRVINEWFDYPPVIAEDLGFLTKETAELLRFSGYPGMRVLQFGFSTGDGKSEHLPHHYPINSVAYPGTHDNDTARGFYQNAARKPRAAAKDYLGIRSARDAGTAFARGVLNSAAALAVVPLADYLNLGSEARINVPSVLGGNWTHRFQAEDLTGALQKKIRRMTELSGRSGGK